MSALQAVGKLDKIFVIDDDSSINEILLSMLSDENYDVEAFVMGEDAVKKAKKEKPDLILLDYFLAGEDVQDVVKKLRKISDKNLPIILMSASVQAKDMGKKLSVSEFISKPFNRKTLLEAIERNIKQV